MRRVTVLVLLFAIAALASDRLLAGGLAARLWGCPGLRCPHQLALPLVAIPCPATVQPVAPLTSNVLVFDSDRTGTHEIFLMQADGSGVRQLTSDARYENWWGRISPDRRRILFYRAPHGAPEAYERASLWVMNADGSALCQLRPAQTDGWTMQGHAEWSPDGAALAMFGGLRVSMSVEIFVTDVTGQHPRQVTARGGINTDVSWSPDGQTLLFNGCPALPCEPAAYEIYAMPASGGSATRLTNDALADYDPYFSPDGEQIAWLTTFDSAAYDGIGAWGIRIMDAQGGPVRTAINDGQINSKPAWSLDGETLFFHRMEPLREVRWGIWQIQPDGSGLAPIAPDAPGNNEFPSN